MADTPAGDASRHFGNSPGNAISKIVKFRWSGRGSKSKKRGAGTFGQLGYGESSKNTGKTADSNTTAPQLHHGTETDISDPDLAEIVRAWSDLSVEKRRAILEIVKTEQSL